MAFKEEISKAEAGKKVFEGKVKPGTEIIMSVIAKKNDHEPYLLLSIMDEDGNQIGMPLDEEEAFFIANQILKKRDSMRKRGGKANE